MNIQSLLLKEAKSDWRLYTTGILCMFLGVQARLTTPIFIRLIIDEVLIAKSPDNLLLYCLSIILIAVFAGFFNYGNRYFNDKAAETTTFRLRNQIFEKLQNQSMGYLNKQETGQLLTKSTSDIDIIRSYLAREFRIGLNSFYYYISIGIIIYFTQPRFLVIFLLILPVLFGISFVYGVKTRPLIRESRRYSGVLSNHIQESIESIDVVRSFSRETHEIERFERSNDNYLKLVLKSQIIRGLTLPVAVLIVSLSSVLILYFGGSQIITDPNSKITIGQLIQFNLYLLELTTPTRLLGAFIEGYTRVNVSGERVFGIIYSEIEIKERNNAISLEKLDGKITLSGVSFGYESEQKILDNISFTVNAGEIIGFLGTSGSGKTSLINLIPRFFDPTEGNVYIDDIELRDYNLEFLRKNIGIVSQETFLFSRTIRENICFGKIDASDEEIIAASQTAQAHNFIMEFPDGYDTIVGEKGITLSGGQQQRISIARSLLINPKILILDDSTSSVDATTENEIQIALDQLLKNRTTLIVTQKVSSLRKAQQIIILENGKIIESGDHITLMQLKGIYSKIYSTQEDPKLKEELNIILEGDK
ncbi:MAG: ABC transporter ATP-binding protein/permease [Candidatus Heimdallarchaeota archaeon]|nr:ABC transporter ATP-binding protein/permease [Candidatus Heimdallarchaeota archaeon]